MSDLEVTETRLCAGGRRVALPHPCPQCWEQCWAFLMSIHLSLRHTWEKHVAVFINGGAGVGPVRVHMFSRNWDTYSQHPDRASFPRPFFLLPKDWGVQTDGLELGCCLWTVLSEGGPPPHRGCRFRGQASLISSIQEWAEQALSLRLSFSFPLLFFSSVSPQ